MGKTKILLIVTILSLAALIAGYSMGLRITTTTHITECPRVGIYAGDGVCSSVRTGAGSGGMAYYYPLGLIFIVSFVWLLFRLFAHSLPARISILVLTILALMEVTLFYERDKYQFASFLVILGPIFLALLVINIPLYIAHILKSRTGIIARDKSATILLVMVGAGFIALQLTAYLLH